jgi:hypothetical protein
MNLHILKAAALVGITVFASSCSSDDESAKWPTEGYLLGLRTSTDPAADYMIYKRDLTSGSLTATGQGIEQVGWSSYEKAGETYIAFDYTNSIAKGYRFNNGNLKSVGQFAFERMDCFNQGPDGTVIAIGAPWGGGSYDCKIQIIDGESVSISKTVTTPVYTSYHEETRLNAWPTATWIQGNKLFVSFYPLIGDTWVTPSTDTAFVSVYSYPALEYQSTFKDTRTGPIGYYSSQPCVLEDESGNHYTMSASAVATGFSQATTHSGILKINNGEAQFDEDYFFDVEELGYKVMGGAYVGDGKVVARVVSNEIDGELTGEAWAAFSVASAPIHNIAILDLNAKTLEIVDEIPLHGGQYLTPFLIENGKVWASITTTINDAFVYNIDPATATATKGARIEGSEIQAFFKY